MDRMKIVKICSIILILLSSMFLLASSAIYMSSKNISSHGNIYTTLNIAIYSNPECTIPLTDIDWGTITPDGNSVRTCYIKNIGNVEATLTFSYNNWNPVETSNFIDITWDRENYVLKSNDVIFATFTLHVASNIVDITAFEVQLTITGNQ